MRKCIATISMAGTLVEKLDAVAAAGFDGVELFDTDLIATPESPEDIRSRCADLGLRIEMLQPFRDAEGVPPAEFEEVLRRFRHKLAIMARLGTTRTVITTNATPHAVHDVAASAAQLHQIGDLAADHGCDIGVEALAWGTVVRTVTDAWELVRRADHPGVGLVVDTFHLLAGGETPGVLDQVPGDRITFLQIADAPRLSLDVLQWSRHHRCFPGQGNLDVTDVVHRVLQRGYTGPLSLEIFSDIVRTASPADTAIDAMRSLLHLEEEVGLRTRRPRVETIHLLTPLFTPPPAPARVNAGFVEIAVDPADNTVPDLLSGLGFHIAGQHRRKDVAWWRNGGSHILVNTDDETHADLDWNRPQPWVTSLGLEADPFDDLATRATALRWPLLTRSRSAEEATLPGIRTASDVEVFLSGTAQSGRCWQDDFVAVPRRRADGSPPRLGDWRGLDHIGITVGRDAFAAEVSFFRTVLGMVPGPITEVIEPNGRLQSRVVEPASGTLRVVLNDPHGVGRRRRPGITQVAFHCDGLLSQVQRMRASGVELLSIPRNYYDDLRARLPLSEDFVGQLAELNVLYDENSAGSFLHVYTPVIAGRFCLELVERIGEYTGFGATDTHVRLVAQAVTEPAAPAARSSLRASRNGTSALTGAAHTGQASWDMLSPMTRTT